MDATLIKEALGKLDPKNNSHWNDDGKPSMDIMKTLLKTDTITRAQIDADNADFLRPTNTDAGGASGNAAAGDDDAKKAKEKPPVPSDALPEKNVGAVRSGKKGTRTTAQINAAIKEDKEYMKDKQVIALAIGNYGGMNRVVGECFSYTGLPGSWFREATKAEIKAYQAWRAEQAK